MLLLHLSDIHFNDRDINRTTDQNFGLRGDTIDDIKKMRQEIGKNVDAILLSGDIAFKGWDEEYDYAANWLRDEVCPAAGCEFENIVVIPGNHDVDRGETAEPLHVMLRKALRQAPEHKADADIRTFVNSKPASDMLLKPLDSYNRFAAKFLCEIGYPNETIKQKPYVERDFTLNDASTLRIWGFNSVLVCDADDEPNKMFVDPSGAQVIRRKAGVTHLVMCHHPFNWLRNGTPFQERIEGIAKLQLFGHEHKQRVDEGRHFTRIKAGALNPDRDEGGWQPGYNFIELSVSGEADKRILDIRLWVRHLVGTRYIAVPDLKDNNPWHLTHELDPWSAPHPVTAPVVADVASAVMEVEEETMTESPPTVRSVAIKILALRESDQRKIITELSLDEDGDQSLADYAFAIAAVRRADARGELGVLDQILDKHVGAKN